MIFRKATKASAAAVSSSPQILTLDNPAGWVLGDSDTVTADAAQKISAVYGAVQYICDFISALPVYVYDRSTRTRVEKHRLTNVLSVRPNEAQTPSDFQRYLTRSLLLRGNG